MQKLKSVYFILFGLCFVIMYAQELPPIQEFPPNVYNAENQNWDISQSLSKNIYVANNKGLLEYNGANWILYPTPNETIMRSVEVVKNRIYTGCYMEFGFWEKDSLGLLQYNSLSSTLKSKMLEDEQVWNIISLEDGVAFQSLNRIYLYNTKKQTFNTIESSNKITKMFLVDDTIMFQKLNEGIFKIENGVAKSVIDTDVVKNNLVINVFLNKSGYLILTESQGFYVYKNKILKKWDANGNKELKDVTIYSSLQQKNGGFIIGTIANGVIHLTKDGDLNFNFNYTNGLTNNTVLSVFEDVNNNIWLGLDRGINCINMASPIRIFKDKNGSLGTIYASAIHKNKLYLGTNQGLFYKDLSSVNNFKFIEGTNGQVWNLSTTNNTLFCSHNLGTFIVNDNAVEHISGTIGTWDVKIIEGANNLALQGSYDGLYILEKSSNTWQLKNKIEGFNNSSRFFEIGHNNNIYVSHEYKGVFNLTINQDYSSVIKVSKVPELPKGIHSSLIKYNNDYLYAYKEGVFKYNIATKKFLKDSVLSKTFTEKEYVTGRLVTDNISNKLWTFSDKHISYVSPGKLSNIPKVSTISIPSTLIKGVTGFENIINIEDQKYLIGTSEGYVVIDTEVIQNKNYLVNINSITKGVINRERLNIPLIANKVVELDNEENNIEFTYSIPEFNKHSIVEYSYKLEGMYNQWSDWSENTNVFFENLPHDEYTFIVKARVGDKLTDNQATYSFKIGNPWYLSNAMKLVYMCLGIIAIIVINYLYKRYYRKQREKLLEKAERDLELKQLENEQQLMRFRNESLTKDIESKNRELAISTMSLIKKNEFLNNIKQELNAVDQNQKLKSVIKIIDKNLNNTDDWKFFQEAFNNADKDFLKKVKNLHPTLTPNDLRLCAYLRLNLSSKEIAPLLNISPRSVEVKRYRLRKKMNLQHEASLTNYILEI